MSLLGLFSVFGACFQGIKEARTPTLTAEHWANKELQYKDRMNGMSEKEIIKNAERGRYYIPKEITQAYPVVHRDPDTNKRIIENDKLYHEDVNKYGAYQATKWMDQGKYNLTREELKIARLEYDKKYIRLYSRGFYLTPEEEKRIQEIDAKIKASGFDYKNTEALRQWKKANEAEGRYKSQ